MQRFNLLIIGLLITCYSFAQNSFVKDSLDIYMAREMSRWQIPGAAIAIVKDGEVVLTKGYGVTSIKNPLPVNEYTLFQIASNSKAFTGTAIALLDYENKLSLDDKVTKYLPYFKMYEPSTTELCTVRDLLCHRLGTQTFQGDFLNWGSNLTRKEIVEHLALTKPVYPFRYQYGYSNAGYITAGEIIQAVTDTTWDDFITKRLFEPMGFKNTSTTFEHMKKSSNACAPHTLSNQQLVQLNLTNIDNMGASASIVSCVADMSKWLQLQLAVGKLNNKQIIPKEVLLETRKSNTIVGDYQSKLFLSKHFITYGLGWQSYDYEGKRVYEHSGGANGFVTKTMFIPEIGLGVIVYTNTDANSFYDAAVKQITESYLNMPYRNLSAIYYERSSQVRVQEQKDLDSLKALVQTKKKPLLPLKSYCGTYTNDFYGKIQVQLVNGKLQIMFEHHPNNIGKLQYLNEHKFLCEYTDLTCGVETIVFDTDDKLVKSVKVKVADFIDYLSYDFIKVP